MARPSKVDRLDPEIREAISSLREQGHTLDEILTHLKSMGLGSDGLPSRSGLHRHIQGLDKLADKLSRSRTVAEALVRKLGDAPENRTARLNIELLHAAVTELALAEAGNDGEEGQAVTFDAKTVHLLSQSLDHLARASKSDADLTIRIREEVERKTKAAAAKAAETVGKQRGLTADTVAAIKSQILGVKVA